MKKNRWQKKLATIKNKLARAEARIKYEQKCLAAIHKAYVDLQARFEVSISKVA